ncbi:hypothetical protein ACWJQ9_12475, partial [Klebsiella pneumoniae]
LNRLIRCVCGKKIGPDPRNFNQRVSLGRNDLLIRTFLRLNSSLIERQVYQGNQQPSLFDAQYTSSIANTTNHGIHWLDGNKQVIE